MLFFLLLCEIFPHHPQALASLIPQSTKLRYRTINRQNIKALKQAKERKSWKVCVDIGIKKPPSSPVTKRMNELFHRHYAAFYVVKRKNSKVCKMFARHGKRAREEVCEKLKIICILWNTGNNYVAGKMLLKLFNINNYPIVYNFSCCEWKSFNIKLKKSSNELIVLYYLTRTFIGYLSVCIYD